MIEKVILKCKECKAFSVEFDNVGTEQEQRRRADRAGKRIQSHVMFTHPRQWASFMGKHIKELKRNPMAFIDAFYERFVEDM